MEQARLPVDKTFKLFIKGEFVRSESGRILAVHSETTGGVTNVARGSRKDARDAVTAAKGAQPGWAGKTAYLRGQILYRLAEVLEGRRRELADARAAAGITLDAALLEVDLAIDRVVHYAGWADKIAILLSSVNPVAGPHFDVTSPEPTGVVVIVPPDGGASLLTLVSTLLPVIVAGNAAIVIGPERDPRTTVVLCEALATSDLPAGVVNVLTGLRAELVPPLASHMGVAGIDLWLGSSVDQALAKTAATAAAENVKRVRVRDAERIDWASDEAQGLAFIEPWVELKTVWHPIGL
jgi:acyl-CoA reductase-like NAD-dependent aldehyde dehydrogenase